MINFRARVPVIRMALVALLAVALPPEAAAQGTAEAERAKLFNQAYGMHEAAEKYKSVSESEKWQANAQQMIERIDAFVKDNPKLKKKFGSLYRAKALLLYWLGKNSEAIEALEVEAKLSPKNILTTRELLRVYRKLNDAPAAEKACKRGRKPFGASKQDKEDTRELLSMCVTDHPSNTQRELSVDTFEKYLGWASKADKKQLRTFLQHQKCIKAERACDGQCVTKCKDCGDKPWDKAWTKACKEVCQACYDKCTGLGDECHSSAKK